MDSAAHHHSADSAALALSVRQASREDSGSVVAKSPTSKLLLCGADTAQRLVQLARNAACSAASVTKADLAAADAAADAEVALAILAVDVASVADAAVAADAAAVVATADSAADGEAASVTVADAVTADSSAKSKQNTVADGVTADGATVTADAGSSARSVARINALQLPTP